MIGPRTFRVACSVVLVLAGVLGLLVATESALRGHSWLVWMGMLFLVPILAFHALLAIAVVYKRALRRSILRAAATASEPQQLQGIIERIDTSEEWIGSLGLERLGESVQKRLDESRNTVQYLRKAKRR